MERLWPRHSFDPLPSRQLFTSTPHITLHNTIRTDKTTNIFTHTHTRTYTHTYHGCHETRCPSKERNLYAHTYAFFHSLYYGFVHCIPYTGLYSLYTVNLLRDTSRITQCMRTKEQYLSVLELLMTTSDSLIQNKYVHIAITFFVAHVRVLVILHVVQHIQVPCIVKR